MRKIISTALFLALLLAVVSPLCGLAQIYDYTGPNNGMVSNSIEGVLREQTSYRLYVPPMTNGALRGTMIWMANNSGDDRGYANNAAWQAFAAEMRMAMMGCRNYQGFAPTAYWEWQHDHNRSMAASVTNAVAQLGIMAGHPELGQLPITISGGSAGANFGVNMVANVPELFICAAVTISEFGFGWDANNNRDRGSPAEWTVPMWVDTGLGELTTGAISRAMRTYAAGRARGAPWVLCMHRTKGHSRISEDVLRTFLRASINLRMGPNHRPGQSLNQIDITKCWLGDPKTYAIAPFATYTGNKNAAMWLPDGTSAAAWAANH